MQTCYRHADRRAGVVCQRCDRPICPDCMRQASVGFHCPECTKQGAQKVIKASQLVSRPVLTYALIAVNVVVYLVCVGSGLQTRSTVVVDYGLLGQGILPTGQEIGVAAGEYYRLVTGGFLHANLIHVAMNMLALYQLGLLLEPAFGKVRFAAVYAASMGAGALGVMLLHPNDLTVGASGAVFGLMGFAFVAMRARGIDPFSTGLGGTILINLVLTFTLSGYISVGGHIGGLIGGAVAGWLLLDFGPKQLKDDRAALGAVLALGAATFLAAALVA
jgi:membrane associated rhomboid family serine protease